jgi:hypothetical protein
MSESHKTSLDMGQLIPVCVGEVVPGDIHQIKNRSLIRFNPLVAPIMHEISCCVRYFFVPYRLLWDEWEDFITGGLKGDNTSTLPVWTPFELNVGEGSLWDRLGFPVNTPAVAEHGAPIDFPKRAYNLIWNQYFMDEWIQDPLNIETNEVVKKVNWKKDYFASALISRQKGIAPALPIGGETSAVFDTLNLSQELHIAGTSGYSLGTLDGTIASGTSAVSNIKAENLNGGSSINDKIITENEDLSSRLDNNTVNFGSATTFNVNDIRLAFSLQRWMELNARGGSRYTEWLKCHFGVSPRDERLQRAEYIGGVKSNVIVSEVLQTSETASSPQGNLAGHGLNYVDDFVGQHKATEFGLIMGLMYVRPKAAYSQGIDRAWLKDTSLDFYNPAFAHMSEQEVYNAEIYMQAGAVDANMETFGYQGRYDELRSKQDHYSGLMRTDFNYWHMGREFDELPLLNSDFIECDPTKRIFAVPTEPGLLVDSNTEWNSLRPIPKYGEPGLIDHVYGRN